LKFAWLLFFPAARARAAFPGLLLIALLLGGCAARPPAAVVERSTLPRSEIPVDGLYQVVKGDTLHGIAFKYGLDYRDIASWSRISPPYTIYPDQLVRLRPPPAGGVRTASVPERSATTRPVETRPVPPKDSSRQPAPATRAAQVQQTPPPAPAAVSPPPRPAPASGSSASSAAAGSADWIWPTEGRILRSFKAGDPARNGIAIVGREGQAVFASAAGEVVYSGNGLIGYGELVIIKHGERMLSAYAHNRQRLVAEGDSIKQGQKVAEMGRNDRNEQVLHFEIRRDGKPVNPLEYLPKR
jgi:lipoprotein NlpD